MYDVIVVGSGFCGSITARFLAEEKNKKVLVIEKRKHIGGNMYDYKDENDILVQCYGPHAFHTNNEKVFNYLKQYCEFENYYLKCMVYMEGKYTPSPFNFQTIDDYFSKEEAEKIKTRIKMNYGNASKATIVEMLKSTDNVIRKYADFLFEKDYSLYTAKQWGISPSEIDTSVFNRVPVLFSYKTGYFDDKFQAMPVGGFTKLIGNILNHNNINVLLEKSAKEYIEIDTESNKILYNKNEINIPIVYTGAIDEILNYKYGVLPYRSLKFVYKTINMNSYQQAPIVAYPQEDGYTRITEFTKIPYQNKAVTKIAYEYPLQYREGEKTEPYYPIINESNIKKYQKYKSDLLGIKNLFLCGRLADYKYYNMDQAIERAFEVCAELGKYYK